jgi:anti-anti-sigma regulatory factor
MSQLETNLDQDRLVVKLRGELTPEAAEEAKAAVMSTLEGVDGSVSVLFDFCGLTESSVFARSVLVELQTALKGQGRRSAYVANVARFRGLALWVINLSEDQRAKSCINYKVADAWLASATTRLDEIHEQNKRHLARMKRKES